MPWICIETQREQKPHLIKINLCSYTWKEQEYTTSCMICYVLTTYDNQIPFPPHKKENNALVNHYYDSLGL